MRTVIAVSILLDFSPCLAEPLSVHDDQLQFDLLLPDGFVVLPADARPVGFHHFYTTDLARPEKEMMIGIRGVGVRADADVILPEEIAFIRESIPEAELIQENWKNLKVDSIR